MQVNILTRQKQLRLSLIKAREQVEAAQRENEAWYRQILEERAIKPLDPDLTASVCARTIAGNNHIPHLTARECNDMLRPGQIWKVSKYFLRRWTPSMPVSRVWLIIGARQESYFNGNRPWFKAYDQNLAAAGVHVRSFPRTAKKETPPMLPDSRYPNRKRPVTRYGWMIP